MAYRGSKESGVSERLCYVAFRPQHPYREGCKDSETGAHVIDVDLTMPTTLGHVFTNFRRSSLMSTNGSVVEENEPSEAVDLPPYTLTNEVAPTKLIRFLSSIEAHHL
jgi:hypothetical protein